MKAVIYMFRAIRNAVIWRAVAGWFCSSCRASIFAAVVFAACACEAKGIPASIAERRGLTNEQIDYILDRHPEVELKITRRDWQGMRLELMRFHNLTNWVDTLNGRQGFAEALARAEEGVKTLASRTNALTIAAAQADAVAAKWKARADEIAEDAEKTAQRVEELLGRLSDTEGRAARAEAREARFRAYLEDKAANGTALQKPVYKALLTWYNSLTD